MNTKLRRYFRYYCLFFGLFLLFDQFLQFTVNQPVSLWVVLFLLMLVWANLEFKLINQRSEHPFDVFFESKTFAWGLRIYFVVMVILVLWF